MNQNSEQNRVIIEQLNENLNIKIEQISAENKNMCEKIEEINRRINDVKSELTSEILSKVYDKVDKIDEKINEIQNQIQEQINEVSSKINEETNNNIIGIMNTVDNKICNIESKIDNVKTEVNKNNEQIDTLKKITISSAIEKINTLELEIKNNQSCTVIISGNEHLSTKDIPIFKDHKRNPIEFLNRFSEYVEQKNETNWVRIKQWLDRALQSVYDNWWSANRQEISTYEQFQIQFKNKYWSEIIQHQIRSDIENGKYILNTGMTPTAYFWSKISVAKHLEPSIQEEILCTKLCFHFDKTIRRA